MKTVIEALEELAYAYPFNVFNVLKNAKHEIRHSAALAWLFDPRENHNFGSGFAVDFFYETFKDKEGKYTRKFWEKKFGEKIIVRTEVSADPKSFNEINDIEDNDHKKRIDILIEGEDFTCTIENKTFSNIHDHQCPIYRKFINDNEEFNGKENFFIFLGINRPKDFDENDDYAGYSFISYQTVLDILSKLIDGKEDNDIIRFIKQYMEVLDEFYGRFNNSVVPIYEKILRNNDLTKKIVNNNGAELTSSLLNVQEKFKDYIINLQAKNDEFIKGIIYEIIKEEYCDDVIKYHCGMADVNDPYAYMIEINGFNDKLQKDLTALHYIRRGRKGKNSPVPDLIKPTEKENEKILQIKDQIKRLNEITGFINQIDFPAKLAQYFVYFKYGSKFVSSRKVLAYMSDNFETFFNKLSNLLNTGWEIELKYIIIHGGEMPGIDQAKDQFILKFDNNSSKENIREAFEKIPKESVGEFLKEDLTAADGKANESHPLFAMIRELFPDDDYNFFKNHIEEYFSKDTQKIGCRWAFDVLYNLPLDPVITDKDRADPAKTQIKSEYLKALKDGLDLFDLYGKFNTYLK